MTTIERERVPHEVLDAAHAAAMPRPHPIRSALIGVGISVPVGGTAGALVASGNVQGAVVVLVVVALVLLAGDRYAMSAGAIHREHRRAVIREMDARGWCYWCHEHHTYRRCPVRSAR